MSSATLEPLPMSMPKTRSSSSLAVSESLADKLPGLRSLASSQSDSAIDQEPASSALSSVSTLSQLSDQSSDDERPSRARRRRVALNGAATQSRSRAQWRSPSPVSSKSSDNEETEDEDSHGQLKPGHKRFLAEGLYAPPKPTSKTIDATQPETVFSVLIETPVSPVAPDADAEVKEAEPEGEEVQSRAPKRASSLMASTKLARDGRGKRIVIPKASASSIETEKPFTPETPLNLPSTFKGPLLPLPTNFGEEILEEKRDFKLSYAIHRDFHTYGPGRQRMQRRLGKGKVPSRYMTINKSQFAPFRL